VIELVKTMMQPILALLLFLTLSQSPPPDAATLVLRNGKIVTVDEARPEVRALAVRGSTIVAIGTDQQIRPFIGKNTEVIDLAGRLAIPGFIDSHVHFLGIGQARLNLNLTKAANWDAVVRMVADAAREARPGDWIVGRGWHQEKWDRPPTPNLEGFPLHDSLSRVSPDNPVLLTHASGHASFANARAMQAAGLTRETPNPAGGEILKDANGNPTGLLRETAAGLVTRVESAWRAAMSEAEREARARRTIALANEETLSKGLTTLHDAGSSFDQVDLFKKIADEGGLGVRLWVMIRDSNARLAANLAKYRTIGVNDPRVTVRAIKVTIDGALGTRGAWLLEPYADLPSTSGLNTSSLDGLRETARLAIEHGYQVAVHAIGDRANREALNVFEAAFRSHPDKHDLRWRIEHAQHVDAADIPRFGALGVIPSMQGIHATSDAPYVLARLGPRRAEQGAYVWQKLMKSGATIANGTDAPVEDVDPIANFYASVSRRLKDGKVFYADQRMGRMEALKASTINAAYAGFEEQTKGSLTPGKLADITVLSKDLLTIPEAQIPTTEVVYTIVGGKVLYKRPTSR
jgi:predicted amidohydrolase YtcJ